MQGIDWLGKYLKPFENKMKQIEHRIKESDLKPQQQPNFNFNRRRWREREREQREGCETAEKGE